MENITKLKKWYCLKLIRRNEMYDLISGEEAKVFWGNGGVIELKPKCSNSWLSESQNFPLSVFDSHLYDFRRKKETVSITLELPKPFQPEIGDWYWFVTPSNDKGYSSNIGSGYCVDERITQFGAYRTEVEVIKARDALRTIKNLTWGF